MFLDNKMSILVSVSTRSYKLGSNLPLRVFISTQSDYTWLIRNNISSVLYFNVLYYDFYFLLPFLCNVKYFYYGVYFIEVYYEILMFWYDSHGSIIYFIKLCKLRGPQYLNNVINTWIFTTPQHHLFRLQRYFVINSR